MAEQPVKIGIITDLHHALIHNGLQRLNQFLDAAREADVDFILELGDFHLLAYDDQTPSGMERNYYSFHQKGWHFIVLDGNYFMDEDGNYIHYSKGQYFKYGGKLPYVTPERQMAGINKKDHREIPVALCFRII